jgi:hypothetical protein
MKNSIDYIILHFHISHGEINVFFFFLNPLHITTFLYQCMGIEMCVNDQALTIPYHALIIVNDLIGGLIYT